MTMVRDRKDINPLLVQVGLALTISLAGLLYSRLRNRNNDSQPTHSPRSSDHGSDHDVGGRTTRRDELHVVKTTPSSGSVASFSAERHDDSYTVMVAVDSSRLVVSPGNKNGGDKDGYLLPEFNELVKEFDCNGANISPRKDVETPKSDVATPRAYRTTEKDDYEHEIKQLKNMVRMLRERERNLEGQLLEFYGLKEQESTVMELQNRLKINNMETKFLTFKIESLQSDNRRLKEQVADHAKIASELDTARAKIKLLKRKLRSEAEQNKEHIVSLQKRVSRLQEEELKAAATDSDIHLKLQRLRDLESEAEELRKSNLRLQRENAELARRLESTQILANSVLENPETEELRELGDRLRHENADLAKEIEQLQSDRCTDVEELVYLRWINACLRYELRNFQAPDGKTVARDLSKSLSPKSEEKVKQLILEYANVDGIGDRSANILDFDADFWSPSQPSCITDPVDYDLRSSKVHDSKRHRFFHKLRRLIRGKDNPHHHNSNASSSGDKSGVLEDSESPHGSSSISTVVDVTSDMPFSRFHTPSLDSSQHSSDRARSPTDNRNSDEASSSTYRRYSWGRESIRGLLLDDNPVMDQDLEKSQLAKFAEALKDSSTPRSSNVGSYHRKSASIGSFDSFKRPM